MPVFNPVKLPSIYEAKQKASNLKTAGLQQQKLEAEVKKLNEPEKPKSVTMSGDWGSITAPQEVVSTFGQFQNQLKTPEDVSRATKWAFQNGAESIKIVDPKTKQAFKANPDGTWSQFEGTEAETQAAQVADPNLQTYEQIMKEREPETPPYKIGQILPAVTEGEETVIYKVAGLNKDGSPIREKLSSGPRYKPSTNITVNTGTTQTTKTRLEEKITEGIAQLDKLYYIETLTKPEFQKYATSTPMVGKKARTEIAARAGFKADAKFLEQFGSWDAAVKQFTLEWRKYITGVAGGEREMRDIEKSTINVRDSHPTFVGKMKAIRVITNANIMRAQNFLDNGIDITSLTPSDRVELFEKAENRIEQFMSPKDKEAVDAVGKLPDGLTEEDVLYNMNKYGKTRDEIVEKFNKGKQ